MSSPAFKLIVRCIRVAPVLSLIFAGCTCSDGSESSPAQPAAPTAVVLPTEPAAEPVAAAEPAESAPEPVATDVSPPTPDAASGAAATRSDCERYVGALAGQEQDQALLEDPQVRALAFEVSDLVTCIAVKSDSEAACDFLITTQPSGDKLYSNEARDCLYTWAMYHEARTYPKGTSFTFHEFEWRQWGDPKGRDTLREATRTGNEEKCAELGALQSVCRAFVKLDKSQCRIEGELPARQGEEDSSVKSAIEEGCRTTIDNRAFLAKGLQAIAESGSGNERVLAQAALGQADACKQFEQAAIDTCLEKTSMGTSGSAPSAPETATSHTPAVDESEKAGE